jgi:hypothetical protein
MWNTKPAMVFIGFLSMLWLAKGITQWKMDLRLYLRLIYENMTASLFFAREYNRYT